MKITNDKLMKIIKEEIAVVFTENDGPNLEDAQKALQATGQFSYEVALYKYLKEQGLNVEKVFDKLKKVPRGPERIKAAERLGINLEGGVKTRGYRMGGEQPAPIRPSVSRMALDSLIINVRREKLLSPDRMEEMDKQIKQAHADFKIAFDAKMAKKPDEVDARYGRIGRNRFKKGSLEEIEKIVVEEFKAVFHEQEEAYLQMLAEGEAIEEAEYRGRKVKLNKPTRGDVKKFKVYVKNAKGNVVKVNFGDKKMRIKKSNPKRRKSFRARHNCDNPGPKWKARYWSCKKW